MNEKMFGLYFLGTSSGVPTLERNVSGIAVTLPDSDAWILVDCGEGTQRQILSSSLSLMSLKAIFITHVHGDHCFGLPGLLASAAMAGRLDPLSLIVPAGIREMIDDVKRVTEFLHLPYEIEFIDVSPNRTYCVENIVASAVPLSHAVPSHAFCFDWNDENCGLRRRIIVAGDNDDPSLLIEAAKTADVLVHEATYTQAELERVGCSVQHSSALSVAEFARGIGLKNLVLTHFNPRYQTRKEGFEFDIDEIRKEANAIFDGNLFLANDHEKYVISKRGVLELV